MIFLEQVEPKWNNVSWADSGRISMLVHKTGLMCFSEDKEFVGWRILNQDQTIEVSQERAIEEVEEIPVEKNTKEKLHCTPTVHTRFTSLLGQIKWLQSRTQFQCWYKFSRCASRAASRTVGDDRAFNKLARQLKSQPVKLQFWLLTRPLRIIGFLDAPYRNNEDGSSQRCMALKKTELRQHSSKDGMSYGSLVDYESQMIKRTVVTTTVAQLYSFMKCFGLRQFPSWIVDGHVKWGCRYTHEDWREELGDNSKNNPLTRVKGDNPHDFHVATGSLFRKYTWSCSHFNSELFSRLFAEVVGGGRHFDHSNEKKEFFGSWRSSKLQDTHGVQGLLVCMVQIIHAHKGEKCFLPERLKDFLFHQLHEKDHAMWCLWEIPWVLGVKMLRKWRLHSQTHASIHTWTWWLCTCALLL